MSHLLTRRRFTKTLALTAVAAPWIVPNSVFGKKAPSERINIGLIGCGNQAQVDLPSIMKLDDTQVVAVCDVNRGSRNYRIPQHFFGREPRQKQVNAYYAKKFGKENYQGCDAYTDFQDVLARKDVDAVMIVTPDHWHAMMACMAAKAGKDIYGQKPFSLTIHDGQQMVRAVRKYGAIFQTGSQYRSNPVVRRVAELIRNGRIGDVKRVIAKVNAPNVPRINTTSSEDGTKDWRPMPVPDGFDYDLWLGPARDVPYHIDRCLYRFRFVLDYSGGQLTNTGQHATDIIQWALGKDGTGPVEFENRASVWPKDGSLWNVATETHFGARYADGIEFVGRTMKPGFGARFEGTDGWIEYQYNKILSSSDSIKNSKIGPDEIRLPVSDNHYRNFIDAVKSRKDPIEPVEAGHRTVSICHLGNIAMQLDRKIKWDPAKEQILDDPEASAMLRRPYRAPWNLEEV